MKNGVAPVPSSNGVQMQWGLRIPLRDGVHLNATLYIGRSQATSSPAIFALTPYIGQTLHDVALSFASCGYPFLAVDVRGRGNSEGVFTANGNEARDGFDVVEWLAQQHYCDGRVAMWGGSYAGYVQWAIAKECPPHLVTIVPVASPFRGVDSPAPNNIFLPYRIQWLNLIAGRASQDAIFADQRFWSQQFRHWFESGTPFCQIDVLLGNPSSIFREWMRHPERDGYWDSYNPSPDQYARIKIPVLTITGSYDTNQRGALMHYREHLRYASPKARSNHFLVIGPWDHAGTRNPKADFGGLHVGQAALVDLRELHREWYDWIMREGVRPLFLKKNVAYYVMGAEEWRYADSLEEIPIGAEVLYLQSALNPTDVFMSGSLLADTIVDSGPDHYIYEPRDRSLAELESTVEPWTWVDQRMIFASSGKHLVYHSAPFERDRAICGFFRLLLWLSIDQPDTDFRVSIHEILIDGRSILLTCDSMRARYRESAYEAKLIEDDIPLPFDFKSFSFIARRVSKGSRLRLVVGPVNSIYYQKNYNSGGVVAEESLADAKPVTVRLFHDHIRPSALYVPFELDENAR